MFVSIGIPFFNAEKYLLDAIRSVMLQSHEDWELILVDDGSTDRSLDVARSVRDERIRVISDGENRRLPYRLNQISSEAKFEFVARMDADDLMSPNRIRRQLDILSDSPQLDLVTAGVCSISSDDQVLGVRIGVEPGNEISGKNLLFGRSPVVHAAILGRKAWFLRNPYDPTIIGTEDYELWLRAFDRDDFRIHILDEALYYYREEGNVSKMKLIRAYESHRKFYKKYGRKYLGGRELFFANIRSLSKTVVVHLLDLFGRTDVLLGLRNSKVLDEKLLSYLKNELSEIKSVRLKGWV